ncbi:Zinc finger matrin-type protein 2 [Porphyridium purpureum]|uniref:Zinc finger matrin-type protein 2 n=1 Tax=Porphyridium purpureum TaxID=35688 RepID=A0A5J4Z152_PORPP|nr:Zinc finger matrin-type protein 2 [Porphyridium purpureum]|eukprot:POR1636..scf295_1
MSRDVQRRTWDKAAFARRAAEKRHSASDVADERQHGKRVKLDAAAEGKTGPVRNRGDVLKMQHRVGQTVLVSSNQDANAGFHCDLCDVLFKDSNSYMRHVNGKKHQNILGRSSRVQRSSVVDVQEAIKRAAGPLGDHLEHGVQQQPSEPGANSKSEEAAVDDVDVEGSQIEGAYAELGLPVSFTSGRKG